MFKDWVSGQCFIFINYNFLFLIQKAQTFLLTIIYFITVHNSSVHILHSLFYKCNKTFMINFITLKKNIVFFFKTKYCKR